MSLSSAFSRSLKILSLLLIFTFFVSCAGNATALQEGESSLPEGFPESFPIPEEARIGSFVTDPGGTLI